MQAQICSRLQFQFFRKICLPLKYLRIQFIYQIQHHLDILKFKVCTMFYERKNPMYTLQCLILVSFLYIYVGTYK